MIAYGYLEKERFRLQQEQGRHVTIGDVCRYIQRLHWCHLLDWLFDRFTSYELSASDLQEILLV